MAVSRFTGRHVDRLGRPTTFRTSFGASLPVGLPGLKIESLFSRKNETANLDAVKMQHADAAAHFDSHVNVSLHVTNNAPHIERLNEGWSAQTTAGFFERALQQAKKAVVGIWKFESVH